MTMFRYMLSLSLIPPLSALSALMLFYRERPAAKGLAGRRATTWPWGSP